MLSGSPPFYGHGGNLCTHGTLIPTLDIGLSCNPRALIALQGAPSRFHEAKGQRRWYLHGTNYAIHATWRQMQIQMIHDVHWVYIWGLAYCFHTFRSFSITPTQPFIAPRCIRINLKFSYYLWCHGHLSSISSNMLIACRSQLHNAGIGTKTSPF